jgi:type IV pilus assembly protein PilB
MLLSDTTVEKLLTKAGKLPDGLLDDLRAEEEKTGRALQDIVLKKGIVDDEGFTKMYAESFGIPYVSIDPKSLSKDVINILPERIARQYNAIVYKIENDVYHLAISDPDDVQAVDFIQKSIGRRVVVAVATENNILSGLEAYREGATSEINKVIEVEETEEQQPEDIKDSDIAEDSPVAQTVNLILEYAIRSDASDIHIEPRDDYVSVRYRIDGVLREANKLPKNIHNALVSRIKILSNLKIDERRVPQDGRFKITLSTRAFALRVSTLPITSGEKVVLRILSESTRALTLEALGYWGGTLARIKEAILQPHGMILVTGPTGSGKSTSLFSILSILNSPTVNISTVEDPVEYKIVGANQTQVNPVAGMTFASGLRALLRQDPNIIMVGEIRDGETADLGVQAALTGHLVFSTLHTNNAATCLPRLLDMGIEPFLIASTVRAVVGQRLVRLLCQKCRESYSPDEDQINEMRNLFDVEGPEKMKYLHDLEVKATNENLGDTRDISLSTTETKITTLWRAHDGGCAECNNNGYKGRMGIYEVLSNTVAVQKLITANGTSNDLQDQAVKEGMVTMQTDGLVKALRGLTSIEEILRVTRG